MALASNPREALLLALSDLDENGFKIFKFHLRDKTLLEGQRLTRGELEGLSRVDLASRLILMYGAQDAVKVARKVLTVMNFLELADQLSHICLNGECSGDKERPGWPWAAPSPVASPKLPGPVTYAFFRACPRPTPGSPGPEGPRGLQGKTLTTVGEGPEPRVGFI